MQGAIRSIVDDSFHTVIEVASSNPVTVPICFCFVLFFDFIIFFILFIDTNV